MCLFQGDERQTVDLSTSIRGRHIDRSKGKDHVKKLKELLSTEFEMKDLGESKKILGMKIVRD